MEYFFIRMALYTLFSFGIAMTYVFLIYPEFAKHIWNSKKYPSIDRKKEIKVLGISVGLTFLVMTTGFWIYGLELPYLWAGIFSVQLGIIFGIGELLDIFISKRKIANEK